MAHPQRSGNYDGKRLWHQVQPLVMLILSRSPAIRYCTGPIRWVRPSPLATIILTWTDEISSVTVAYQGLHDDRSVADSLIASPRRALVSPAR
jgi:hypothetical protein